MQNDITINPIINSLKHPTIMKKTIISLALAIIGTVASYAADINASWNQITAQNNSLMLINVPEKNAKDKNFESMQLAVGQNMSPEAVAAIGNIVDKITDSEEMLDVTEGTARVRLLAQPINDGKEYSVLFYIVENGTTVVLINGQCTAENFQKAIKDINLEKMVQ
jgi:hypothetical protein